LGIAERQHVGVAAGFAQIVEIQIMIIRDAGNIIARPPVSTVIARPTRQRIVAGVAIKLVVFAAAADPIIAEATKKAVAFGAARDAVIPVVTIDRIRALPAGDRIVKAEKTLACAVPPS
jgi:hypothetical protein